jgi:hypothetical protein
MSGRSRRRRDRNAPDAVDRIGARCGAQRIYRLVPLRNDQPAADQTSSSRRVIAATRAVHLSCADSANVVTEPILVEADSIGTSQIAEAG